MTAERSKHLTERAVFVAAVIAAATALAVLLGLGSLTGDGSSSHEDELAEHVPPETYVEAIAQRWIDAWAHGDVGTMRELAVEPTDDLATRVASFRDGLRITALRGSTREADVSGADATITLDVAVDLEALGTWAYPTHLTLVLPSDAASPADWRVRWSRAALHPALTGSRRLSVSRAFAPRARLLAADGTPLSGDGAAPTPGLARQLVGRVGTAETDTDVRLAGDPAGTSGLQSAFDRELGGTASGDVQVVEGSDVVSTLAHIDGAPPVDVRTSIDLHAQSVAESVLAGVTDHPAAIVALRPSTGEVVATASVPQLGFNRSLFGRYPPGSTFKVITSTALLLDGITPDTGTTCPHDVRINGRVFQNAEDEELGDISFATAFAHSCNTAFVQLASELEPDQLVSAAERYGFNSPPALEVGAETSSFPEPHSEVDQASAAIGQGRVLTTPLQMASVAASVASGAVRPVTLRAVAGPVAGTPMPPGVAETLQSLMHLVVTEGTAASAGLPPGTAGKTGTAEFGSADPPHTHAWFIGFRGDLAFAVVVEDGGFGGRVAAPLARAFLSQL